MSDSPLNYGQGEPLQGQAYDPIDDLLMPFSQRQEQVTPTSSPANLVPESSNAATDVTPQNQSQSQVRAWNRSAIQTEFLNIMRSSPGKERMFIPPVMTGFSLQFNAGNGDGTDSNTGIGLSAGSHGSISLSLRSSSEGSASSTVEGAPVIRDYWAHNVPVQFYDMFMVGSFTWDDVIARLATPPVTSGLTGITVNRWPNFKPESVSLMFLGGEVSVRASAGVQQQLNVDSTNISRTTGQSTGQSFSWRNSGRVMTIPPTLHGAMTIMDSMGASSNVVSTQAGAIASMTGDGVIWLALSETTATGGFSVTALVSPDTIAATSPAAVPTSGLYLYDVIAENYKYGVQRCRGVVVDASYFAT